jgi:lipoyl(octanoyl) transferase
LTVRLKKPIDYRESFCQIRNLGLVDYQYALRLQRELVQERLRDELPDTLLLLEHPAVITIGKSGSEENLLIDKDALYQEGVSIFYTDRGGDVTAHNPGQLVGYPIIDIVSKDLDPHSYVYSLEEVVIQTLKYFSITAHRSPNYRGVWIEAEKVCSIGVKFNRSVTSHGFALNVNNDLNHFTYIYPCGIRGVVMTSVSMVLGREVTVKEVTPYLIEQFLSVFQTKLYHSHQFAP